MDEISRVLSDLKIFEKSYEFIRLVDPVLKRVVNLQQGAVIDLELSCYGFWGKNKICDNCVSLRAYQDGKTYVKIDYSKDKIYMMTAVPIELSNRRIIVELIKDATNSLIVDTQDGVNNSQSIMRTLIDNMNNLTITDALTEAYNRRYMNEKLPVDLLSSTLSGKSLSVIMADIDFFKKVNDTYGHLTGDCILKSFAKALTSCLRRDSDWVARFGGEEFIVCLPGSDLETAKQVAESMRAQTEQTDFLCGEHTIKITASFGIFSTKPSPGDTVDSLVEAADKKLYLAKNNGRNRVEY